MARKFCARPAAERRWILIAVTLLPLMTGLLHLLPFRVLRSLTGALPRFLWMAPGRPVFPPWHIGRCVSAYALWLPGGMHCLSRALVTEMLLRRAGHPASLRLGVLKEEGCSLEAHAWVECRGRIVIGHPLMVPLYRPLERRARPEPAGL
jgi:hypothetical protein